MKKYMRKMYLPEMSRIHPLPKDEVPKEHDMTEPKEPPTMETSRKRKLAWAREIIHEAERYGAPKGSTRVSKRPKKFYNYVALMCDVTSPCLQPARGRDHHGVNHPG